MHKETSLREGLVSIDNPSYSIKNLPKCYKNLSNIKIYVDISGPNTLLIEYKIITTHNIIFNINKKDMRDEDSDKIILEPIHPINDDNIKNNIIEIFENHGPFKIKV